MGHDCKKDRYVLVCMRYRAGCLMRLPLINPRLEHGQVQGWPPGLNKDRAGDELQGPIVRLGWKKCSGGVSLGLSDAGEM